VAALKHFTGGPRNILVQLSLALSGLGLQMEGWSQSAVQELIVDMGTTPALVPGLLQFLAVLPDEIVNAKCPLPVSHRRPH
jgi:transportin-3